MYASFTITTQASLKDLPVEDGQLIIIRDGSAMYYDIDGIRHEVKSTREGYFVTVDTDQVVLGQKDFQNIVKIRTLLQGENCNALNGSHAEGNGSTAYGQSSHAQGISTSSDGVGSASSGYQTTAQGNYSASFGNNSVAAGIGSLAAGAGNVASGPYSTVVGTGNDPNSSDLFQVGNGTAVNSAGEILPESSRTKSNAMRVTKDGKVIAETDVELESGIKLSNREYSGNKVTSIGANPTHTQYPSARAVKDFIDAMPEPMIFKGTLGTGGTVTSLPSASASNEGFTYKVITAGTYQNVSAKVGDTLISNGSSWVLIPSGDEPAGTVTNVAATGSNGVSITGGPITTSGTLAISGVNATQSANGMMSASDKKKLDGMDAGANAYILPTASTTVKGGIKVGTNLSMSGDVLNAKDTTYGIATSSTAGLVKSGTDITVDSSGNVSVNDDSHNHVISNIDGLQSALNGKAPSSHKQAYTTSECTTYTSDSETMGITPAAVKKAITEIFEPKPHTHSVIVGSYTGNGGQQNPNYFGVNKVGALMMNTSINGDSHYKDFLIMDCYSGDGVGGATAIGVDRQEMKAFIMGSDSARTAWTRSAELITTSNIGNQSVKYAASAGSAPASDVYSWAKAASKPSYSWSEITGKPTSFTPSSHTHNYAGSSSAGGAANSLAGFTNTTTSATAVNNATQNGHVYVNDTSGIVSQSDGACYVQAYSTSWVHQIYGDYRTGQIAVRGKNNGNWQSWRVVIDSANYKNYCTPANIGAAAANHSHSSVLDVGSNSATTFAYSKTGLDYANYTWLAGWNGYELRAVNKSQFATAGHTHSNYLTGITKDMVTNALGYTPPTQDTNTWRGIQDNLTSDSTTDSLSAKQGKVLKGLVDGKAASSHTHSNATATSAGFLPASGHKKLEMIDIGTGDFAIASDIDFWVKDGNLYLGGSDVNSAAAVYKSSTSLCLDSTGGCWIQIASNNIVLSCSGTVCPDSDNSTKLGESSRRWSTVYAKTSTISTSDKNLKKDITELAKDDRFREFFLKLQPVSYTFVDGQSGRTHVGFVSQDVEQAMSEVGLTDLEFAGFCKDLKTTYDKETDTFIPEYDEEGNPEYLYSLRYEEFIALNTMMIQGIVKEQEHLESRISKLEERIDSLAI